MHHNQPPSSAAACGSLYIILCTAFLSLPLVLFLRGGLTGLPPVSETHLSLSPRHHRVLFDDNGNDQSTLAEALPPPRPPSLAYFISGSANDSGRIIRLLNAIYHPRNLYLLHLDNAASQAERESLAVTIHSVPLFRAAQNVHVIGKADNVCPNGPSALSSTLHGASVLLRLSSNWDWFINLSAADYPLVTQDDLLHIFSYLPGDVNFVNHTGYIGWRESKKLKPIVVDPALSLSENTEMFFATQKRPLPDAFRLFTGSSMAVLSRKFIECCILGTDNLPRTLLMYLSNTPASASVYFPTVLCNSHQFRRTTMNHSLRYTSLDSRQRPMLLNTSNFDEMIKSGAAFASPFLLNNTVLDRIDQEILQRSPGKPVPGGWCLDDTSENMCTIWGDVDVLKPGPGAKRLERCLIEQLSKPTPCLNE